MAESNLTTLAISNDNFFIEKLNSIERFSRQISIEANLPTVSTKEGGLFGLFGLLDHKVTGEELNNLTEKIQKLAINQNIVLTKIYKEFIPRIYETLMTLDERYIQKILFAVNTALIAIDDVNFANKRIDGQQKDIIGDQQEIKRVIDQQKLIIQVLKDFKEKLEKIDHLYDIDKIFSNSQNFQIKIEFLEQSSVEQKVSIEKISERQTDFEMSLSKLRNLNNELSLELKQSITETEQRFSEIKQNIEKNYEEHIDKYNSLAVSLVSAKESIQDVYSKTNYKIEQVSKETNNKYEAIQNDLTTLRYENAALSKSLMVTRIILATGFLFLLILIILFLTGVIK